MQEVVGVGLSNGGTTGTIGSDRIVNIRLHISLSTPTGCPFVSPPGLIIDLHIVLFTHFKVK